ncbi:hypothetical protein BPTFM16_01982 [Altererythrobacter insulae]|nr:hypothetical protein BPTFM16_01982 [Altererythrobacter insulae]
MRLVARAGEYLAEPETSDELAALEAIAGRRIQFSGSVCLQANHGPLSPPSPDRACGEE